MYSIPPICRLSPQLKSTQPSQATRRATDGRKILARPGKHHSLSDLLNIDFDQLNDPDAVAPTLISPPEAIQPRLEAQFSDSAVDVPDQLPEAIWATHPLAHTGQQFLSLNDAADWLCISRSTIMRLTARGILATVLIGARRKISLRDLQNYAVSRLAGVPVSELPFSNNFNEV